MVLIRLAHVAEMPTPGELVKRLTEGGAPAAAPRPAPGGGGGGMRAVANGGAVMAEAVAAPAMAQPQGFRDIVALASGRKPMLHAHLVHSVHPVRFAAGLLEIRVRPDAPRDLAAQLGALLQEATGERWTIALSNAEGEPTLAEQGRVAEAGRRAVAQSHPLVQAILQAFPGAAIEAVRDEATDAYGLPAGGPAAAPRDSDDLPDDDGSDAAASGEEPADFTLYPPEDA